MVRIWPTATIEDVELLGRAAVTEIEGYASAAKALRSALPISSAVEETGNKTVSPATGPYPLPSLAFFSIRIPAASIITWTMMGELLVSAPQLVTPAIESNGKGAPVRTS